MEKIRREGETYVSKIEEKLEEYSILELMIVLLFLVMSLYATPLEIMDFFRISSTVRNAELYKIADDTYKTYGFDFAYVINSTLNRYADNGPLSGIYLNVNVVNLTIFSGEVNRIVSKGHSRTKKFDGVIGLVPNWELDTVYHEICHGLIYNWGCTAFSGGPLNVHESTCTLFGIWMSPENDASRILLNRDVGSLKRLDDYWLYNSSFLKRDCINKYFRNFEYNCKMGIRFDEDKC